MLSNIHFKTIGLLSLMLIIVSACASKPDLKTKQAGLYFSAGTQSLMEKEYTEALRNLLEANKLTPNSTEILTNLGMAYYLKGEKEQAIAHLNQALKADKNNSDAKVNLASIFFKDRRYDDAEKIYKQVLKDLTYDKQARTYYNLGLLEVEARRNYVSAENYFKKSINEDDNYCPSYFQLGLLNYTRRQFNSALKNFKEATLGACTNSAAPHYYQALTFIELNRFSEARIKLDEVETKFKDSVYATKARTKVIEINHIENKSQDSIVSRKMQLESPDF